MGLLAGKRLVVTGVLTDASLAFGVAKLAQEEGAEVVLTGAGRGLSLTERTARKLPDGRHRCSSSTWPTPDARRGACATAWRRSGTASTACCTPSAYAPPVCLGGGFMEAGWDDVAVALNVSAYSLKALADAFVPLMTDGGSIVGLDFDATVAWPAYDWMGVAKAALESTSRYLARELGPQRHPGQPGRRRPGPHDGGQVDPRVLASSRTCGPSGPRSAGTCTTRPRWPRRAWRSCRTGSRMTTGEMLHVDGGHHAMGA